MQIVIDILDDTYGYFTPKKPREMTNKDAANWFVVLHKAIFVNGKVLPKGHGRLVDENDLVKDLKTFQDAFTVYTTRGGGRIMVVCTARTIVEADKEGE